MEATVTCEEGKNYMKIVKGNKLIEHQLIWLRDHCRCDDCYNGITSQRKVNVTDIPIEIRAKDFRIECDELKIVWEDDHKSEYPVSFLEDSTYENYLKRLERNYRLWTKREIVDFPVCHADYDRLLESDDLLRDLIKSLIDYGVGFVENVPPNVKETEQAVLRLSHVQHTLFGGMWEFSDFMTHNDTAYTNEELEAHTDNTYFTEAAGLQVLHCLNHTGTGGESLLVDGFKAVEILRGIDPDAYKRLTTVCVEAEYLEPGYHHSYTGPIIKLHPITKQPEQIRFNVHDRATVSMSEDEILHHYKDYKILGSIIRSPDLEWRFKLNPGTVLIFDNFRVLHGRSSYTGRRTMCGCYIGRGDFLSKARVLNLL